MKFSAVLLTLCAVAATASPVDKRQETAQAPNKKLVYIKSAIAGGTGCEPTSVQATFNDARTIMTLIFSKYQATIGPKVPTPDSARRNCQINLKLSYPTGYQYSVVNVTTRGYAAIDAGVTGQITSNYYFSGQEQHVNSKAIIYGPHSGDYEKKDHIETKSQIWSPCDTQDGMANINTDIRLTSNNPGAAGLLTVDSIDANVNTKIQYDFQWRPQTGCNSQSGNGNAGNGNAGNGNAGNGNAGYGNSGNSNSGYGNSGYGNNGYGNSGYGNSGYGNSGYGNSGYGYSGYGNGGSRGYAAAQNSQPASMDMLESTVVLGH